MLEPILSNAPSLPPPPLNAPARKRLGEILIERGKLDAAGLERALRLQQDSGEKLGALLVTLGACAQRDVAEALAERIRHSRAGQPLGGGVSIRELVEEGRR